MNATRNERRNLFASSGRMDLPPEALDQLRTFIDSYNQLRMNAGKTNHGCDHEMANLHTRLMTDPSDLWWSDIALAELCIVERLTASQLRSRIGSLRRRLGEVVGETRYMQYLAGAPNAIAAELPELQADAGECIRAVYYFYGAYGIAARSRSGVTKQLLLTAVAVLIVQAALAFAVKFIPQGWLPTSSGRAVPTLIEYVIAVSAAAVLGSVVSVQRRLQDPKVDVDPFYRFIQTKADRFSIAVVSPVYGAIFGCVVFALLASTLFSTKLVDFNASSLPSTPKDVAALLVLGFLAGFAEQLVPDALSRLAARAFGDAAPATPPASIQGAATGGSQTGQAHGSGAGKNAPPPPAPPSVFKTIPSAVILPSAKPTDATPAAAALGHDASLASGPTANSRTN